MFSRRVFNLVKVGSVNCLTPTRLRPRRTGDV